MIVNDFISPNRLKEVGHGMETQQVNESLNNTSQWKAPKNKVLSGSMSLTNRVSMACCTHLIGPTVLFSNLFDKMGMDMQKGTNQYLDIQANALQKRQAKQKQSDMKQKHHEANFKKLRKQLESLMQDRAKNNYYQVGVGRTCTDIVPDVCPSCNLWYSRRSSKHCLAN